MRKTIRATLRGATTPREVDRYLYANYSITGADGNWVWIEGEDRAGFTAQAIIDRLASGLIWAAVVEEEIEVPIDLDISPASPGPAWEWPKETEAQPGLRFRHVNDLGGQDPAPRFGADENDLDEEA